VNNQADAPRTLPGRLALLGQYRRLLTANWRWLLLMSVVFLASLIGGVIATSQNPAGHRELLSSLLQSERFRPAGAALQSGDWLMATALIFLNNLGVVLLAMLAGILIVTEPLVLWLLNRNAYLVGSVIVLQGSQGPWRLVQTLLPHAIFELPALVIAVTWSLKLAVAWLLPAAGGRRLAVWRATLHEALWLVPLLTGLLLVAAIVEVLISARLSGIVAD
jgi:uncharacterized membrane protein SpoIIM required for sporulation